MKITNKQELRYVMDFYNIPYVRIEYDNKDFGKVFRASTKYLSCERGGWVFKQNHDEQVIERAMFHINADADMFEEWNTISKQKFTTRLQYVEYECGKLVTKRNCTSYCWESDLTECNVEVNKNEDDSLSLTATIFELSNFLRYANDHMRYCSGCRYSYGDEEVNKWMKFCEKYGFTDEKYKWWRIGIVD